MLVVSLLPKSCMGAPQTKAQKYQHGGDIIVSVRFTPDGWRFISASFDGTVAMWDARTGKRMWQVDLDGEARAQGGSTISHIHDMDLSPDGNMIAVSYSQDHVVGDRLAGKSEHRIGLLDARNGREQRAFIGHTALIGTLDFSRDGRLLASGSADYTVRLWNVSTGQQTLSISLKERGAMVAFSPDGKLIAIATRPTFGNPPPPIVGLYDVQGGRLVRDFPRQKVNTDSLAFSPDGQLLAIASDDLSGAQTDLWELTGQKPTRTLTDHETGITTISFSPKGRLLASGELRNGRGIIVLRDLTASGQPRTHKVNAGVSAMDFSPDATRLAVGTDKGQIILISLAATSNSVTASAEKN
jgi:WD40 repeat protein